MKIKLKGYICIILFITGSFLFAQTGGGTTGNGLSRGEALFKENNAKDAVQVLEYEIMNGQISDNTYNFLGLGYYQLGEYEKSLDAFKRGLKAQPDNAKVLSYNMGNTQYALKDYASAASSYSDSMKADPLFYDALLNRANALLMAGQLKSARDDYIDFNTKCPDDPQHERIEMLIKALEEEITRREEEARLLAEQNKAQWEEYDGNLADSRNTSFTPDWEEVETYLADGSKDQEKAEWERINREDPGAVADKNDSEKLASDKEDNSSEYWEEFEHEKAGVSEAAKEEPVNDKWESLENEKATPLVKSEEVVDEKIDWLTFSDEDLDEMKELEKESREEHEKWLEENRRRSQEIATREAQSKQQAQQLALEEERKLREQMIEDMRKSEEERRKKLLEDVANSLQGSDSTNLTSGAEDLIDYDLEGELD